MRGPAYSAILSLLGYIHKIPTTAALGASRSYGSPRLLRGVAGPAFYRTDFNQSIILPMPYKKRFVGTYGERRLRADVTASPRGGVTAPSGQAALGLVYAR